MPYLQTMTSFSSGNFWTASKSCQLLLPEIAKLEISEQSNSFATFDLFTKVSKSGNFWLPEIARSEN